MLDAWSGSMLAFGAELVLLACAATGCGEDRVGRLPSTPFSEATNGGATATGGHGPGASGGSAGAGGSGAMGGGGIAGSGGTAGAAGSGLGGAGGSGGGAPCDPVGQVSDFQLLDKNPNSPSYDAPVSPRDYLQRVSGWFFGYAT